MGNTEWEINFFKHNNKSPVKIKGSDLFIRLLPPVLKGSDLFILLLQTAFAGLASKV